MGRTLFTVLIFIAPMAPAVAHAQAADETYFERLEFDPNSGEWKAIAPPIPGTAAGDLALARSLLARGEFEAARKAFENWFKVYTDSGLRSEALFYAAETEVSSEDAKRKSGTLIKAYEWLEELLEAWPGTELADRAMRKELIIAEMLLFKDRKVKKWKGMIWLNGEEEAIEMLNRLTDYWAPNSPLAEQALRVKADYHFINGEYEEAELAYSRLMREYPRGKYHKVAMLRSGQSALARFPGVEFDDADLLEAEVYFQDFQRAYPEQAAEYQIPQTLDRITESLAHKEYTIARFMSAFARSTPPPFTIAISLPHSPARPGRHSPRVD
ncbi:MAG: outer membrane protein assembly factor BamD [Planctomycetes bacterium]|nr:outer membrane protein assembly factor BamD [Planctomycetota bacterium]